MRCWHVNCTRVPASPHWPKLAVPWPRAGPGGQTLRQGPALAARILPPGRTRGLQMLKARRLPWSAATAGPPSRTRRVKRSAEQGSWAPRGGLQGHSQSGDSSLARRRGLLHERARGTKGLWPGLCRGPHSPHLRARASFLPARSPARRVRSCPGPRPPGSAAVPHAWWPPQPHSWAEPSSWDPAAGLAPSPHPH